MRSKITAAILFGAVAALPATAMAQGTPSQGGSNPAVRTDDRTAGAPVPGANSFTEGQARSRIEDAGFTGVTDLQKDDQGIWRGRATRGGAATEVAFDFQGNIFAGGRAVTGAGAVQGDTSGSRDGTAANPPGTAVGRAVDGATGAAPRPDGTPGNPPGTAAGRAVDSTLGTNTTGANPGAGRPDGAAGNPPSTAAGRAVDRAQGQAPQPDGTPANPAGTAAGRAVDRALGTNATGANPSGGAPAR